MAGMHRLLERHKARLSKDPDVQRAYTKLIKRGFFTQLEERHLENASEASERTNILLDKLSTTRNDGDLRIFLMTLEEVAPHLLTELLLDRGGKNICLFSSLCIHVNSYFTFW